MIFPIILLPLLLRADGFRMAFISSRRVCEGHRSNHNHFYDYTHVSFAAVLSCVCFAQTDTSFGSHLNPLTFIIEEGRNVLIFGKTPNWIGLGVALAMGLVLSAVGFWWFQKTRKGFADVL